MATFRGLPANFDPEKFERKHVQLHEALGEGVTVLQVTVAKRTAAGEIRCWDCKQAPDGSWDCVQIPCPPTFPPTLLHPEAALEHQ
jgi:hypothetical protein